MDSPKSRASKTRRRMFRTERKRHNRKFYTSKDWRRARAAYINAYRTRFINIITKGAWYTRNGDRLTLTFSQVTYLLSLDYIPCEICLKLFAVGAYDKVCEGIEVDHIERVNPENALDSAGWGDPFDQQNLQLLCRTHHAKKSNREK